MYSTILYCYYMKRWIYNIDDERGACFVGPVKVFITLFPILCLCVNVTVAAAPFYFCSVSEVSE